MTTEPLDLDELVEHWTLLDGDHELVAGKRGTSRLVFTLMLKFYARYGRFPDSDGDLAGEAVEFVARQVHVPSEQMPGYEFAGRTVEYYRAQIRGHFGFRACTVEDAQALEAWLAENVAEADPRQEVVRDQMLDRCRKWRVEPPTKGRIERIVRAAVHGAQTALCERIVGRLSAETISRIEQLLAVDDDYEDDEARDVLALVKASPGNVSLDTTLTEIAKLEAVRAVGLPASLFSDVTPRVLEGWRQRAMVESPSHLREHPRALRVTLLAALLWAREREITDTLVDLLISTVHRIGAKADKKVTNELIGEFKRIANKETLLFKVAEASVSRPDDLVKEVVFPAVGGEQTLLDLVAEYKSSGPTYRRTVQTKLKASYSTTTAAGWSGCCKYSSSAPTTPRTGRCWTRSNWSPATPGAST